MDRLLLAKNRRRELLLFVLALIGGSYEAAGRFYWSPQTFNFDHTLQVRGAQSLLAGEGVSIRNVDPADFSSVRQKPITAWPPGYSWALAPVIAALGDFYAAVMTLDLLLLLLLFLSWWWITYQLRSTLTFRTRAVLVGWWFVVASPAWHIGPNDILSLAFFLLGTALTIRVAAQPAAVLSVAAGLAYGVAAAGRYAYWPLVIVGPVTLLWRGRRRFITQSVIQGVCAGTFVAGIYLRNSHYIGRGVYLKEYADKAIPGFFPKHLLAIAPFPASITGLYGAFSSGGFLSSISRPLEAAFQAILWLAALLLAAGVVWGLRFALKGELGEPRDATDAAIPRFAATHGLLTAVLTVGMLAFLSVRYPPQGYPTPDDTWVYLAETRYYAPIAVALFLGLGWALETAKSIKRPLRAWLTCALALTCVLALGPAVLRAKRFVEIYLLASARPSRAVHPGLPAVLRSQFMPVAPGSSLVYLDEDRGRRSWAAMMGVAVVDPEDVTTLNRDVCDGTSVVLAYSLSEASGHMLELQEQLRRLGAQETGRLGQLVFLTNLP